MKRIILLTILILILPVWAWAGVAHYADLSDAGSTNQGTFAEPFNTIALINAHAFATGDDLYFKAGTDEEVATNLVIDWDGELGDRAIIGAYDGDGDFDITGSARPILDGGYTTAPASNVVGLVHYWDGGGYVTIQDLSVIGSAGNGIQVGANYVDGTPQVANVTVQRCYIYRSYGIGILISRAEDCTVTENIIEAAGYNYPASTAGISVSGMGMDGQTDNILVSHNEVFDCEKEGIDIIKGASNCIVEYNTVYDNFTVGIYPANTSNCIVRYNLVYESSSGRQDYGIAYDNEQIPWTGSGGDNIKIYGNLVAACKWNIVFLSEATGSYLSNMLVYNNTVVDAYSSITSNGYNFVFNNVNANWTGNEIKNNISYTLTSGSNHMNNASPTGFTFRHNNYDDNDPGGNANDNAVIGAPGLSKTSGWQALTAGSVDGTDFKLLDTNNCEDAGTNVGGTPDNPYYNTLNLDNSDFTAFTFEMLNQNDHGAASDIGGDIYKSPDETPPANNDCSAALVHFILDENVLDSTANEDHLTPEGGPAHNGGGIVLNGTDQYAHIDNLSNDISGISIFSNFSLSAGVGDGELDCIAAEYDPGADERVWILTAEDAVGAGDGNDYFKFCVGHTNGTDRECLLSTFPLVVGDLYSVLSTFKNTTPHATHIYIFDADESSGTYGDILNGATGETVANLLDDPGNGDYTQNIEPTDFTIGAWYNSGNPVGWFEGPIYEIAVYDSVKSQQDGQDFSKSEYEDAAAAPAVQSIKRACGNLTSAGTMTLAIAFDQRVATQVDVWTVGVTFDYPVAEQTATYSGRWNEATGWTQVGATAVYWKNTYTEPTVVKEQGVNGQTLTPDPGGTTTTAADSWDWVDWAGTTPPRLYVNVGDDPYDDTIVPTPYELYASIDTLDGWRQDDFDGDDKFSDNITLGDATIKSMSGEDATVTNALTGLGTYLGNTVANPFLSTAPHEFTDTDDYVAWIAAGGYGVPNDYFVWTEDADTDNFDASAGDGTPDNEITYDGQGFAVTGSKTYGDYSIITRMKN